MENKSNYSNNKIEDKDYSIKTNSINSEIKSTTTVNINNYSQRNLNENHINNNNNTDKNNNLIITDAIDKIHLTIIASNVKNKI